MKDNNLILWVVLALVVGGLVGFFIGKNNQTFSPNYMGEIASMIDVNGQSMMQMGNMMMSMGQMMQQKGTVYNDTGMMQKGKELEDSGAMMKDKGNSMIERSNIMTGMMR